MAQEARRPAGRRKRRSYEEIEDRLLRAAGEEFKRCGFSGATTAAIARRAEVTEAQLFRYFGSKADLFREAVFKPLNQHFFDFHARHLAGATEAEGTREQARAYIAELQAFLDGHGEMLLSLAVAQAYSPESLKGVSPMDSLSAYFDRGAAMMTSRIGEPPTVDPRLLVRVSFAAVMASVMFKDWLFPEGLAGPEQIRDAIIDFVIDGINANSDPGFRKPALPGNIEQESDP